MRGYNAIQSGASLLDAGDAFRSGDTLGGLLHLAGSLSSALELLKACFVAGTPVLTPAGSTPIERLRPGDLVLSRDEHDPAGDVRPRRVLQAFVRVSPVLTVVAGGREVGTTGEHPFFVAGKGWVDAGGLRAGDRLVTSDGREVAVEGVWDAGRVATVYNVEVEHDHTYFVGEEGWGFDVWVHNVRYEGNNLNQLQGQVNAVAKRLQRLPESPRAVVGAYDVKTGQFVIGASKTDFSTLPVALVQRAELAGGLGAKIGNTTVGHCAEVDAAAKLMRRGLTSITSGLPTPYLCDKVS